MKAVLLVTGMSLSRPPRHEARRLEQVAALFSAQGCAPDLLSLSPREAHWDAPFSLPGQRGFAVAPIAADEVDRGGNLAALEHMLARITPRTGYAAMVSMGLDLPGEVLPEVPRIYDAGDGRVLAEPMQAPALLLAADEQIHQKFQRGAARSARLPMRPSSDVPLHLPRGYSGWPQPLLAETVAEWREILSILAGRFEMLTSGLLLDAESIAKRDIPGIYHPRWSRGAGDPASLRALGLAVLPGIRLEPYLHTLVELVARGCPVLTTPAIAERFEGRWRLPTAEHAEGLAGWIQGWTEGRDVEMLCRAALETRSAFLSDVDAMTDHVGWLISEVLAER